MEHWPEIVLLPYVFKKIKIPTFVNESSDKSITYPQVK